MGRRGIASSPAGTGTPFRRTSRSSVSSTPGARKTTAPAVTVIGAETPGAWKTMVASPVPIHDRTRADCRAAAARCRASTSSTVSGGRATTSISDANRGGASLAARTARAAQATTGITSRS